MSKTTLSRSTYICKGPRFALNGEGRQCHHGAGLHIPTTAFGATNVEQAFILVGERNMFHKSHRPPLNPSSSRPLGTKANPEPTVRCRLGRKGRVLCGCCSPHHPLSFLLLPNLFMSGNKRMNGCPLAYAGVITSRCWRRTTTIWRSCRPSWAI